LETELGATRGQWFNDTSYVVANEDETCDFGVCFLGGSTTVDNKRKHEECIPISDEKNVEETMHGRQIEY